MRDVVSTTRGRRIRVATALPVWLVSVLAVLSGCAFQEHRRELERLALVGDYRRAAEQLDAPRTRALYGDRNELLWLLDRGAVALALGEYERTIDLLTRAERIMELHAEAGVGDRVAQWLINDTEARYLGEPYEDMYTNVLKLLAHLQAGRIQGAATVDARRMANKANVLRDRYLRTRAALDAGGGESFRTAMKGAPFDSVAAGLEPGRSPRPRLTSGGQFVESPLGLLLTAVTFMKSGEPENQRVAGRRLEEALEAQGTLVGPVDPRVWRGLGERAPEEVNLLLVALSGRGPTKEARTIGPIPVFTYPVYFQLPVLVWEPSRVRSVRVRVFDDDGRPVEGADGAGLSLIEDLSSVAAENHRRQLPLVYARTLLRAVLKGGVSFAVTETVRRRDRDGWATLGAVVAGMAVLALTERADLRCWVFLPGQAHAGMMRLPPGAYRVRVEYLDAAGRVLQRGDDRRVSVESGADALTTVVEHTWK
jgi:hypothetical protein